MTENGGLACDAAHSRTRREGDIAVTRQSATLASFSLALVAFAAAAAEPPFEPVTDAMLQNPDPADWLMWRRTQDSWGYSPLDDIDRGNVDELALAWSMDLDEGPSQEGIPLVYDGVLYFPRPLDVTYALDAATGKKLWEHRRTLPDDLGTFVPFPQTNRNLAIYGRLIIDNGADVFIYALDARDGQAGLGNQDPRLQDPSREARLGAARGARRADLRAQLPTATAAPRAASSRATTPARARSSGASARSRSPASPAATVGATFPTSDAGTSALG